MSLVDFVTTPPLDDGALLLDDEDDLDELEELLDELDELDELEVTPQRCSVALKAAT